MLVMGWGRSREAVRYFLLCKLFWSNFALYVK
jgi:hypothetical protein